LSFTPADERYVVFDESSHSTYRVGRPEYLILKQFRDPTNLEEAVYKLRAEAGFSVPYDRLNRFIQRAIQLNLIEVAGDSAWSRVRSAGPFAFRKKMFDPGALLERVIAVLKKCGPIYLFAGGSLLLAALIINATHLRDLWTVRSWRLPPYGPIVILFVYAST